MSFAVRVNNFDLSSTRSHMEMKAILCPAYGGHDILKLTEMPIPRPGPKDILIRNHATAVNSADVRLRKADPTAVRLFFGMFKPRKPILGGVFAGEVQSVGADVKNFRPGDRVMGMTGMSMGTYATYVKIPMSGTITRIPDQVTFEAAASVPFGGSTALHFLQKAGVQPGSHWLVYGASGAVGSAAVQILRYYGVYITAVSSRENHSWLRTLGAEDVLDYKDPDFEQHLYQYDGIFEAVGKWPLKTLRRFIAPKGTIILASAGLMDTLRSAGKANAMNVRILTGMAAESPQQMEWLAERLRLGEWIPQIDRTYPMEQMAEAHRYVDQGHKKGNVIITLK